MTTCSQRYFIITLGGKRTGSCLLLHLFSLPGDGEYNMEESLLSSRWLVGESSVDLVAVEFQFDSIFVDSLLILREELIPLVSKVLSIPLFCPDFKP